MICGKPSARSNRRLRFAGLTGASVGVCTPDKGNVPKEYITKFAQEYERGIEKYKGVTWNPRPWEYSMALFNTELTPRDVVLDVGCGDSYFITYVAQFVSMVYGIDNGSFRPFQEWFKNILTIPQYNTGNVKIIRQNATTLPFPNEYFDKVFTFSALEHFWANDDIKCCKEIYRVLKNNGIFCGTVDFNPITERPLGDNDYCRVYTRNSFFNRIVEPAGFNLSGECMLNSTIPESVIYTAAPLFFSLEKKNENMAQDGKR